MNKFTAAISQSSASAENQIQFDRGRIQRLESAGSIDFTRKVEIFFDRSHYTVKSVETRDELLQALSLRQEVFHREFCRNLTRSDSDFDELDLAADHLVVIDHTTETVVGNYRLVSSRHSPRFYSQNEFSLTEFLQSSGDKLELSRSCVHSEHRSGIVIQLLWRGVIEYMRVVNARYLFGCTSVKTMQKELICRLVSLLDKRDAFTDHYGVEPLPHCRISHSSMDNDLAHLPSAEALMPPIMKAYLRAGARLCRHAAVDMDFECTDFFTILDRDNMHDVYSRKYLG